MRKHTCLYPCVIGVYVLTCLQTDVFSEDRPQALLQLERHRHMLETAHIEWSHDYQDLYGAHPRFITTRIAGDDSIDQYRGDEEGVFDRLPNGTPQPNQMKPISVLSKDGEVWMHPEKSWGADYFPDGTRTPDMRALGLTFGLPNYHVEEALWHEHVKQPSPRRYSETMEGEYQVVRAETDYGTLEWWLDPRRDGEIVRYVEINQGEVVGESRVALRQYDGVWFPESVSNYAKGYRDGKEPRETIRIHYASFNQPEHPRSFEPKDIGVEAGIHIKEYDPQRKLLAWNRIYDGDKIVSDEEYLRRMAAGEIQKGPTVQRMAAEDEIRRQREPGGGSPNMMVMRMGDKSYSVRTQDYLTMWEEYTRGFIERYKLNDEQTQKAWTICLESEAEARGHLAKLKSKLDEIQERLAKASESKEKAEQERAAELRERRQKLFEPIDQIFERQLKPRLEKLPTRAQKEAAESTNDDRQAAGSEAAGVDKTKEKNQHE
jgi:hypothetical protein